MKTVAAATEELASSITEIGSQVGQAAKAAGDAVEPRQVDQRLDRAPVGGRPEDRRRGGIDQRHRGPDQSAGAQCHHRGGARGRGRQGICGGRHRGEVARRPDRQGDRGRHHPDQDRSSSSRATRSGRSRTSARSSRRSTASTRRSRPRSRSRTPPRTRSPRNVQDVATGTAEVSRNIAGVSQVAESSGKTAAEVLPPPRRCRPRPARCAPASKASCDRSRRRERRLGETAHAPIFATARAIQREAACASRRGRTGDLGDRTALLILA